MKKLGDSWRQGRSLRITKNITEDNDKISPGGLIGSIEEVIILFNWIM